MNNKYLINLDLIVAGFFFFILVSVTFTNVIMRYIFSDPITWTEEVQMASFLWVIFLGAGAAFRYGSHVAVEIVFDLLKPKTKYFLVIFNYILMMLLLAYLIYLGINLEALLYSMSKHTYILQMQVWMINSIVLIGCLFMMFCLSVSSFNEIKQLRQKILLINKGE